MFGAPLIQRAGRLPFEVDEVGITLHHQHLAEVQVAVDTGPHATNGSSSQTLHLFEQLVAPRQQLAERGSLLAIEARAMFLEALQGLLQLRADALLPLLGVGLAGAFVGEGRIFGLRGKRHVHLAEPLTEQAVEGL